jgi:hypothetical protein
VLKRHSMVGNSDACSEASEVAEFTGPVVLPIYGVRPEAEGFSLPRSFLRFFILSSIIRPPHISHLITYSTTYSTTVLSADSTM